MRHTRIFCDSCGKDIKGPEARVEFKLEGAVAGTQDGEVVDALKDVPRSLDFHLACLKAQVDKAADVEVYWE